MGDPPRRPAPDPDAAIRPLKWSSKEKTIARRAFDQALARELKTALLESKDMAARIEEPSGLWELERFLTQRRKEIDRIRRIVSISECSPGRYASRRAPASQGRDVRNSTP